MLASSFKFTLQNATGQSVNGVAVKYSPWKFGATGALEYGTPETVTQSTPVADAASGDIGSIDNSSNLNLGGHLEITFPATASATGTAYVFLITGSADQETVMLVAVTDITAQKIFSAEI